MYACSFKKHGQKLSPNTYELFWNLNPALHHDEYRIPLGDSNVVVSTRPKAFNCNVNKAARTDTFTVQSFNLSTLLDQPPVANEQHVSIFVVTGTVPSENNKQFSVRDTTSTTFLRLWEDLHNSI